MDPNYANPGGGSVGSIAAAGIGASAADRYNPIYYKEQASCQRSTTYNAFDPYGGFSTGGRASNVYPYDAEAEFKERTGMGKAKTSHQQMAGSVATNSAKQYNLNSCYGNYNQTNATALTPENYYAYAYDQHHHYPQQQQYHQSQLQQQYKYKMAGQQQQQLLQQQQEQQQQQQQQSVLNAAMKMSPAEYGYAPYHHPYYHPHYHHPQKGGVSVVKTLPDASAMPYVNSKVLHSPAVGGGRAPPYSSYHSYPASAVAAGHHHHTYQSQSVCDDSRWLWNSNNSSNTTNGGEYQNSCRGAYPLAKQNTMWPPSSHMQYQNTMSTGYPAAAVAHQSCCPPTQSASTYYPSQQYAKYSVNFGGSSNDLYGNPQVNASLPGATTNSTSKVYTDLNAQPQGNAYQSAVSAVSYHQPGDCSVSSALDYSGRYLQPQQTDSPSGSSASSTSSYSQHYYHPYSHQMYSAPGPQEPMYGQQQVDSKIGITTKSQNLRDFLSSWNEDEDECADRAMSSADVPFIEQLHLTAEHFSQIQDNPIMENHLQFKGSFSSRPKIHVGITVDSSVEPDQYINLPDIIIDIEKSNKEVVSNADSVPLATISKEEIIFKEEKQEDKPIAPPPKKKRKFSLLSLQQKMRRTKRHQRKWKKAPRKQLRIRRVQIRSTNSTNNPPLHPKNPQSLKCLCVSLINSEKFRNRILGPSEIVDSLINHLTTADNEAIIDVAAASAAACSNTSSSVIPKLSDLCKNALNSSFDRDVLVINLDEILDSDNLFVVQCDINENILENYVDVEQLQQQPERPQQSAANNADLVEILNDNNNNNNSTSSRNYIPTTTTTTVTPKRCCSVTEVSNLPLDNPVEHNNLNLPNNRRVHTSSPPPAAPLSPSSSSCPAVLCYRSSSSPPLIEQNCPTKRSTAAGDGHEQLHEMLMLSAAGIVHDDISQDHHHHHHLSNDSDLLMLDTNSTPSFHHEEIVPDNLKKFQNEKFLKYLHAKYVQGNLSEFYHANRIIKKYKKRIIKKLLNIVVR